MELGAAGAVIPGIWKAETSAVWVAHIPTQILHDNGLLGAAGGAVVCADPNWNGVVPPKPDDCPNWNVGSGIVAPNWNGLEYSMIFLCKMLT